MIPSRQRLGDAVATRQTHGRGGQNTGVRQTDQIILEAYPGYWDTTRYPRVQRLVFDHALTPKEAQERVMSSEGQVDLFVDMRPLDILRVAQSPLAKVVKERSTRDQASFLFLYVPLQLYAVNKEVNFEPYPSGLLFLSTTSVTDQHWSVRQQTTTMHE